MKFTVAQLALLSVVALAVQHLSVPAMAQCYGGVCEPPPSIEIASRTAGDVIIYLNVGSQQRTIGNSMMINGEGISLSISFAMHEGFDGFLSMSNSESPFGWDENKINLSSYTRSNGVVDTSAMQPEYSEVWYKGLALVGELIERDDFWEFLGESAKNEHVIRQLEEIRDGYYVPSVYSSLLSIRFNLVGRFFEDNRVARSYSLEGPSLVSVSTTSLTGDPDPELNIEIHSSDYRDRWVISVDPETQTCEISKIGGDPTRPLTEEDWLPAVEEIRYTLQFFYDQLPVLRDAGVVDPEHELNMLIEKSLEAIDTYPMEARYDYIRGDYIL